MLYRPSREDVVRLIDHLSRSGWIRNPRGKAEEALYLQTGEPYADLEPLDPSAPYSLWFAGGPPSKTDIEWPDDEGCFLPEYCEDVKIVCGTRLATPRGEGATLPCPSCRENLIPQLSDAIVALWSTEDVPVDLKFIDDEFLYPAPETCRSCGAAIDVRQIVEEDGQTETEAPFSVFMINFNAIRTPPAGMAYMPPELMESLAEVLGVPFRSVGRYS
jgi:hypothetical protein